LHANTSRGSRLRRCQNVLTLTGACGPVAVIPQPQSTPPTRRRVPPGHALGAEAAASATEQRRTPRWDVGFRPRRMRVASPNPTAATR
jgi:hypothetical protein